LNFSPPNHQPSSPAPVEKKSPNSSGELRTHALEERWSREVRQLDKAGEDVEISISINDVVDNRDRMVGRITVGRDVTDNRRMQRDLLALNREREVEANIAINREFPVGDVRHFPLIFRRILQPHLL